MRSKAIRIGIIAAVACVSMWSGSGMASAGGGCHIPPTTARGDSVDIADLCFDATVLYVEPGTDVTWTNRDAMTHMVVGVGDSWGDPGISLLQGDTVRYRFDENGVYPYSCLIHPGMVGAIVVGDGVGTDVAGVVPVASTGAGDAASTDAAPAVTDAAVNGIFLWIAGAALLLAGLGGGFALATRSRRRGAVAG